MSKSALSRKDALSLGMIVATFLMIALLYNKLPEQIPVHWNAEGEIDGYASKLFGALMMPCGALATFILIKVLPVISPKGFRLDDSRPVLDTINLVLVALFCTIGAATVMVAMGVKLDMVKVILIGTGLMLILTGNVLSKVRKNFFVGIRTPWTLADDEVWAQTHRLAGRSFFGGGLLVCVLAFFQSGPYAILAGVTVAVLLPVVYSFVLYRRLNPSNGEPSKRE